MPAVDSMSSDMAAKVHADAVNRDYVLEPRLGAPSLLPVTVFAAIAWMPADPPWDPVQQSTARSAVSAVLWSSWIL